MFGTGTKLYTVVVIGLYRGLIVYPGLDHLQFSKTGLVQMQFISVESQIQMFFFAIKPIK